MTVYYFGCISRPGHDLWYADQPGRRDRAENIRTATPWGYNLDGEVQPQNDRTHGAGRISHTTVDDVTWTVLGIWDNSVDTRPGSCSAFVFDRELTDFADIAEEIQRWFPDVVERILRYGPMRAERATDT